jgi:exonuclease VII large subunit
MTDTPAAAAEVILGYLKEARELTDQIARLKSRLAKAVAEAEAQADRERDFIDARIASAEALIYTLREPRQ